MKAKTFVLTFRDHLLAGQSLPGSMASSPVLRRPASSSFDSDLSFLWPPDSSTPKKLPSILPNDLDFFQPEVEDLWVLNCINVAHVQPIVEALDEDGSGFISVKEANKFAGSRPKGWRYVNMFASRFCGTYRDRF